ncbi:MAG: helix-turn-helix domain-containing protein, partial [Desulfamplus sp.]|nr:helix-turn-helix domain-containing protein [Desulfamplus sp.]
IEPQDLLMEDFADVDIDEDTSDPIKDNSYSKSLDEIAYSANAMTDAMRNEHPLRDFNINIESGSLRDIEERVIYNTLDRTEGNRTHAAKLLGISVRTLRNKLNEYKEKR